LIRLTLFCRPLHRRPNKCCCISDGSRQIGYDIFKAERIKSRGALGSALYWRWKSKALGGSPTVPLEIRRLIGEMSIANPPWGAPRIHGELLNAAHDRNRSAIVQTMSLTRSLIPQHRPILDELLVRLSLRQGQAP
jgi:hypothetical protein